MGTPCPSRFWSMKRLFTSPVLLLEPSVASCLVFILLLREGTRRGTMDKLNNSRQGDSPGRRAVLRFSAAGLLIPLGAMAPASWRTAQSRLTNPVTHPPICRVAADANAVAPGSSPRELKITWNTNAVCNVGVAVADTQGFFAKRNLKVEKINFAGATDQLLELLASGKADAGVGMALAWMKPLEQGFDVKLTAAIHGGCARLITTRESGIAGVAALKGKAVGTSSMASPEKNFISILAIKQ